jgi:hypothetical protein
MDTSGVPTPESAIISNFYTSSLDTCCAYYDIQAKQGGTIYYRYDGGVGPG